jgi:hypothetical protein
MMRWESNTCLSDGVSIVECEADTSTGGGSVSVWNPEPVRYVVVVEGRSGQQQPFRLSARCE